MGRKCGLKLRDVLGIAAPCQREAANLAHGLGIIAQTLVEIADPK